MDIRPARPEDTCQIAVLLRQLGYERTLPEVDHHITASAADPDVVVLVAVAPDGRLAGCLQAQISRRLAEGQYGEIASLVVDDAQRSRGIGARLVKAALNWLQASGIARLRVRCNTQRTRAHRFYERLNFHLTKTQKVFDMNIDTVL
ncbi:MAG: GNAT family N-acetyltransferase [Desulfobacterales bacterium]|jgi:N-acetylglutamate synthase-like GNAT family acetyltransferase